MVCDGYVKYEEAKVDILVAILKTKNCDGSDRGEYSEQATLARAV